MTLTSRQSGPALRAGHQSDPLPRHADDEDEEGEPDYDVASRNTLKASSEAFLDVSAQPTQSLCQSPRAVHIVLKPVCQGKSGLAHATTVDRSARARSARRWWRRRAPKWTRMRMMQAARSKEKPRSSV